MTKDTVQESGVAGNIQPIFVLNLTLEQLRKHWELILIGSSMADYLKLLDVPSESLRSVFIEPKSIIYTLEKYPGRSYEKELAKRWYELGDQLTSVYETIHKLG